MRKTTVLDVMRRLLQVCKGVKWLYVARRRCVFVPNLVHFGNHFLPIIANFDMPMFRAALLFYRVTAVPFLPKMDQRNWE